MNPIYRFELSKNGANTRTAKPNYNNDLAIEYALEQNEEFYRGKLSGKLTFQQGDYAYIKTAAFDTQFDVEIFISYNGGQTWASYWKGKFFKTDCEFNDDDQTAIVTPTLNDRYNDVLAGLDKEYNLIDLAPVIQPIKLDKRPMIQIYVPGQTVIGCFLSGMWWEQECEPVDSEQSLVQTYYFAKNKTKSIVDVTGGESFNVPRIFMFDPVTEGTAQYSSGEYTFVYQHVVASGGSTESWDIKDRQSGTIMWHFSRANQPQTTTPYTVTLAPVSGTGALGNIDLYIHDISVYARYVTDVDSVGGVTTYDIPADDIVPNNRNYHKVIGYYFPDTITFYIGLTTTPTKWGLYQPGQYYQQPYVLGGGEFYPIARAAWSRVSLWFSFYVFDWLIEEQWRKEYTLKDAFPISSVISVLLGQIAPSITHDGTTDYSAFLYAENNPISNIAQTLFITPKSNVINSGYDQPAQKAPITLKQVLNMLRDCFRCYWFVDDNNRFRIEHISYFMRGGSYSGSPVVGIDLTKEIVTRNGKPWSYVRNQYQFDKPDMAARYQFGWMDDVTQLFDGYPIDIVSKYVNPENIENIDIAQFTSDIDYILLNPDNISNDGFVLLAAIIVESGQELGQNVFVYANALIGRFVNQSGGFTSTGQQNILVTDYIELPQLGLLVQGPDIYFSANVYVNYYDADKTLIATESTTDVYVQRSDGFFLPYAHNAKYVRTTIRFNNTASLSSCKVYPIVPGHAFKLPYLNFVVDETNHILQNAYVAFVLLQGYYAYDMPATHYRINGVDMVAIGRKKLKTQTIKFPVLNEPNMTELVKTGLGNGTIQKMSVNLSSRNANTTLKYDTE